MVLLAAIMNSPVRAKKPRLNELHQSEAFKEEHEREFGLETTRQTLCR
jgi:hypothetical protein